MALGIHFAGTNKLLEWKLEHSSNPNQTFSHHDLGVCNGRGLDLEIVVMVRYTALVRRKGYFILDGYRNTWHSSEESDIDAGR